MNKLVILFLMHGLPVLFCSGQSGKGLPEVSLRGLDGRVVSSSVMAQTGKPVIILFWATWCRPCLKEMTAMADLYEEWKEKSGVVIYAVSIDDSRTQAGIGPMIRSRGWDFEFLSDINGEFKRAMGVSDIPHLFILSPAGKIIHQHSGYTEGAEELIPELLRP